MCARACDAPALRWPRLGWRSLPEGVSGWWCLRMGGGRCEGMGGAVARGLVSGAVVLGVVGVFAAGQSAYARSDWGVAAGAEVPATVLWGKCLLERPGWLGSAQPGIDPRSRLYHSPVVSGEPNRELVGWRFYGTWDSGSSPMGFECVTDTVGLSVAWLGPTSQ